MMILHFKKAPLWVRIYIMVYILIAVIIISFSYKIITLSNQYNIDNELTASLDKHLMLASALKMSSASINDELNSSPELQYEILSIFIKNYGKYYIDNRSYMRIHNQDGGVIFSSLSVEMDKGMKMEPPGDGRRSYVIRKINANTLVFVSGYIKLGHHTFRLDYVSDISKLVYSQKQLSAKISLILSVGMLLLAIGLFFLIRAALKPLSALSVQAKAIAEGNYDHKIEIRSNDEIGQLAVDFNQMAESIRHHTQLLQDGIKIRENFIASLAHELKTPLTSIMGYVSLMKNYDLEREEIEKSLNFIDKESKRLDEISKKLLSLFRLSMGEAVTKKKIPVDSMLHKLKSISGMYLAEKEQLFKAEASIKYIDGDEELLLLLLNNLIENASKFSAKGFPIILNIYEQDLGVVFSVKDYGYGITKEHIDMVFQPFFMSDPSRSKKQNGCGLGLSLCKAIVEAHDGSIRIQSEQGKGTCVFVSLPKTKFTNS